jgi:NAD(P)-dependent dehydrogenase (short-subunit alcohol dehydrogenase family)
MLVLSASAKCPDFIKGHTWICTRHTIIMLQALKNDVKGFGGSLYPLKADLSREEEVVAAFTWVKNNLGGVDVLINNAGITGRSTLHGTTTSDTQCRFLAFTFGY